MSGLWGRCRYLMEGWFGACLICRNLIVFEVGSGVVREEVIVMLLGDGDGDVCQKADED